MRRPAVPLLLLTLCACSDASSDGLANFELDPAALDLGLVEVGAGARADVAVRNTGDRRLSLRATSPSPEVRVVLPDTPLEPGAETRLEVAVQPRTEGPREIEIEVFAAERADVRRVLPVRFDTRAGAIACDVDEIAFGDVVVGTAETRTLACTNTAEEAAMVELDLDDQVKRCDADDARPFCVRFPDGAPAADGRLALDAGETVRLEIEFAPRQAARRSEATVTLRTCAEAACETEIELTGTAVEQGFWCLPTLEFAPTTPGRCTERSLSCENRANVPVTVRDWGLEFGSNRAFEVEAATTTPLAPSETLAVQVRFCPVQLGDALATLEFDVARESQSHTYVVELRAVGGGADLRLSPEQLDFGRVSTRSVVRGVVLATNLGGDDVTIQEIRVDDAGTGGFRLLEGTLGPLLPGESEALVVAFEPVGARPYRSGLTVMTDDPDEPELRIPLLGEGADVAPCQYTLSAPRLDFGEVRIGRLTTLGVVVRNTGTVDCLVSGPTFRPGSDPAFSVGTLPATVTIPPGEGWLVRARFLPRNPTTASAELEIGVSDPSAPLVRVPLTGRGGTPSPFLSSADLDFGRVPTGCGTTTRTVRLHNPTSGPLVLAQAELRSMGTSGFGVVTGPLPVTVAPGDRTTLEVRFTPAVDGPDADQLRLSGSTDGGAFELRLGLIGDAAPAARQTDRFRQGPSQVDVLFVADFGLDSGLARERLGAEFARFVRAAAPGGVDYQVGVTSMDANREAGRLLHPQEAGAGGFTGPFGHRIIGRTLRAADAVFAANLLARAPAAGPLDEAGLLAAHQALSPPVQIGHNGGFQRTDADLFLVFLGNAPDESLQSSAAPSPHLDYYADFFGSLPSPGARFRAAAIAGDVPGGCTGGGLTAVAAPAYTALAEQTGGPRFSHCSPDYGTLMEELGDAAFGPARSFDLTQPTVTASVTVTVDGVAVPGPPNWRVDAGTGRLSFLPTAVPPLGATIEVTYPVVCE